jgi:cysteine desulfurase/selenocysteine lyase
MPKRSLRAISSFLEKTVTGGDEIDSVAFEALSSSRFLLADLLGCSESEIALLPNTGIGINVAAHGMDLKKGENVVLPVNEFPSNYYPWANLRRKGVEIKFAQLESGLVTPETVEGAMDSNTRALAMSAVDYSRGYRPDLVAIGELCRRKRIAFIVDGMQSVGVIDFKVKDFGIDVLACGGGKWTMAPQGAGFVYISEQAQNWLKPTFMTWLSFRSSFDFENLLTHRFDPFPSARKFELGTYAYADYFGLKESLSLIKEIGIAEIWKSAYYISGLLLDFLKTSSYQILSPTDNSRRSGIVAFTCAGVDALYASLREKKFIVSKREGAIRVSCHFYNIDEEIRSLIEELKKYE